MFCIPSGFAPVLVEFKLNSVVQIVQNAILKDASDAPSPATFFKRNSDEAPDSGGQGTGGNQGMGNRGNRGGTRGNFGMRGGQGNQSNQDNNSQNKAEQLTESLTGMGASSELGY